MERRLTEPPNDVRLFRYGEPQSIRALSICREKCTICFDGVDCDFECVRRICLRNVETQK